MPSFPSGPGSVQGPVNPDSRRDVEEKQQVEGQHGHRKVEEATVERKILAKPRTSPRKRLSEFGSIKPVTLNQRQVAPQKTESPPTPQPPVTPPLKKE